MNQMDWGRQRVENLAAAAESGFRAASERSLGRLRERSLRLAVTGLSRSGKTVFTTALTHDLLTAPQNPALLPFLKASSQRRLIAAERRSVPEPELPDFPYEAALAALTSEPPSWPPHTTELNGLRIAIRYVPGTLGGRLIRPSALVNLEIIDYPGEWLLDLPLLETSFARWSSETLALAGSEPRRSLAGDWIGAARALDFDQPPDEAAIQRVAGLYKSYLQRCREAGLALLQPGRFLHPGEHPPDAPALSFFPLPASRQRLLPASLGAVLAERFGCYQEEMVRRFYRRHFARFDRQVVLVDVLKALSQGHAVFEDTRRALAAILKSFDYGRSGLLSWLTGPRIGRVLFAATKADHVGSSQRYNLERLLQEMVAQSTNQIRFRGVETATMAIAAIRATEDVVAEHQGQMLSMVRGTPLGRTAPTALFPGEIPARFPAPGDWDAGRFRFLDFQPVGMTSAIVDGFPHIGLDLALEYLIGDRLR